MAGKKYPQGNVYIIATFNNTIVTVTDEHGNVLTWSSAGSCGFKGSRKGTPFAAQQAAEKAAENARAMGMERAIFYVQGPGSGREAAIRGFVARSNIKAIGLFDITKIPHNGVQPPNERRV